MYFSALSKGKANEHLSDVEAVKRGERFTILQRSVIFQHDLMGAFPLEYLDCDIFYSDLPWPRGMEFFNSEAGIEVEYDLFMRRVASLAVKLNKPVILIAGRAAEKYFPSAHQEPILLNGAGAVAYSYKIQLGACSNTKSLLYWMSKNYDRVGDFCCGLGRAGQVFTQSGKSFVMSDYNGKCIRKMYENKKEIFKQG